MKLNEKCEPLIKVIICFYNYKESTTAVFDILSIFGHFADMQIIHFKFRLAFVQFLENIFREGEESLADIYRILRGCLEERNAIEISQFLALLKTNLPLFSQISLIANQHSQHIRLRISFQLTS